MWGSGKWRGQQQIAQLTCHSSHTTHVHTALQAAAAASQLQVLTLNHNQLDGALGSFTTKGFVLAGWF